MHSRLSCIALIVLSGIHFAAQQAGAQRANNGQRIPVDYAGPISANTYTPLPIRGDAGKLLTRAPIHVEPISDELRDAYQLKPFYKKTLTIDGIPIIASEKVSDYALLECAWTLDHMLIGSPQNVKDALTKNQVRMGIISVVEYTMDIPENQTTHNMEPKEAAFQDHRSRGLGGMPFATCAEENLLNLHGDPYFNENITIHEFSHTVASAIKHDDPDWYDRLKQAYRKAIAKGLFARSYSATNEQEYWAEGAQAWFDCACPVKDATVHSGIWTREQLEAYDPGLAALLREVYGDLSWRYVRTTGEPVVAGSTTWRRSQADVSHLRGLNRERMPTFDFRSSPRIQAVPDVQQN